MNKISIAIDGPAGAGKSTIAKIIANKLKINYIDTGAMYRALTLKVLHNNIDFENTNEIIKILNNTDIDFHDNHIYLDGKIVDNDIRDNEISTKVSFVAKIKEVRQSLVYIQRRIATKKSVVMDGRDIGTYVLPDADFKFYITASVEERGLRRYKELKEKDTNADLNKIIEEIKERDRIDSTREFAPLKKAIDAIGVETTAISIEESVNQILKVIEERS